MFIVDPDPKPTITKQEAIAAGVIEALNNFGYEATCQDVSYARYKCVVAPTYFESIVARALELANKYAEQGFVS